LDDLIYHYTDANALKNIISENELWLTHTDHLNDYSEGKQFYLILKDVLKEFPDIIKLVDFVESTTETYCLSFSKNGDLLSQWRGYCPPLGGYSLGFLDNILSSSFGIIDATEKDIHHGNIEDEKVNQVNFFAYIECKYTEKDTLAAAEHVANILKKSYKILCSKNSLALTTYLGSGLSDLEEEDIDEINNLLVSGSGWFHNYSAAKMSFKDVSFIEEAEKRLFINVKKGYVDAFYRTKNSVLVPYLKFKFKDKFFKKIIIGPTADKNLAHAGIQHYLHNHFGNSVDLRSFIKLSKIPFRSS
jgi:hypothetical protein